MPPAQWTTTRFSNGCATTGADGFEGSRQAARLFFGYSVVISARSRGLTQTVTQTRKKAGGYRRTQWIAHRAESTQKRRKALRHNAFRRSSYLHTQEVTGSSPAVSTKSRNHCSTMVSGFFFSRILTRFWYFDVHANTRCFGLFRLISAFVGCLWLPKVARPLPHSAEADVFSIPTPTTASATARPCAAPPPV